jgi:hypothetical protein
MQQPSNNIPENSNHSQATSDHQVADARQFLHWLYGDDPPRWLTIWLLPSKYTQWIRAQNLDAAATYAINKAHECDVYFGVGLRGERLPKGRGDETDVIALPALYVDIDLTPLWPF